MKSFENKVVVITGAGSGIGQELALQMAQHGAKVAANDISPEGLAGTAQRINAQGGLVRTYLADVADLAQMHQFAGDVMRDLGQIDILINNAGVTLTPKIFDEISEEEFKWVISINMWGAYNGVRAFLPHLRNRPEAHIVNVSSVAGLVGLMGYTPYSMSKSALRGLSEALQMELIKTNITVTCVHPGGVKTNIMRNAPDYASDEAREMMNQAFLRGATLTPEKVSAQIIRAIRKKKHKVIIGPDARMINLIHRLLPNQFPNILYPAFAMMMGPPPAKD